MISILSSEYTLSNLLIICLELIIPLIIYIIAFNYVSDAQQEWFANLHILTNIRVLMGTKGIFFGCITFFFTGLAILIILDYYYHKIKGEAERPDLKLFFQKLYKHPESCQIWHFYLTPLMLLFSVLGFPIAYQTKSFIPHVILVMIALLINLYLIIFYAREISYIVGLFLLPLFIWQIINVATFIIGTE